MFRNHHTAMMRNAADGLCQKSTDCETPPETRASQPASWMIRIGLPQRGNQKCNGHTFEGCRSLP